MPDSPDVDRRAAQTASEDELSVLVHDTREAVLLGVLENPRTADQHVRVLARRADLSAAVLEAVARWAAAHVRSQVRRDLAFHPRLPQTLGVRLVRELPAADLVELLLSATAAPALRQIAEELILTRLAQCPLPQKIALARRGSARVAGALVMDGQLDALSVALDNPSLNEGQILKALARPAMAAPVVAAIAQHGRWSHVHAVRLALLRQPHVPLSAVLEFLPGLSTPELRTLAEGGAVAAHIRPHVRRELADRLQNRRDEFRRTR